MKKANFKASDRPEMSEYEYRQWRLKTENASSGDLTDCPICHGKGDISVVVGSEIQAKTCECIAERNNAIKMKASNVTNKKKKYTLDTFHTHTEHHKKMKATAVDYLKKGHWLYIGGQVGVGKTHLGISVARELIHQGYGGLYMMWRTEIAKIKAGEDRYLEVKRFTDVEVLYIDDLFKAGATQADIGIAFDILNERQEEGKKTIISCEYSIKELGQIDQAIAGRIVENAGEHVLSVERGNNKDERKNNYKGASV